jgi:hypothetical protein
VEGKVWRAGKRIRIRQHRWIMEQHLGRPLSRLEVVHHINGNRTDNRLENLEVKDFGAHSHDHNRTRSHRRGYKMNLSPKERANQAERMRNIQKRKAEGRA